jgi:hypothetical protein
LYAILARYFFSYKMYLFISCEKPHLFYDHYVFISWESKLFTTEETSYLFLRKLSYLRLEE